jgi:hypothetical protein
VIDIITVFCFFANQSIGPPKSINRNPLELCRFGLSVKEVLLAACTVSLKFFFL